MNHGHGYVDDSGTHGKRDCRDFVEQAKLHFLKHGTRCSQREVHVGVDVGANADAGGHGGRDLKLEHVKVWRTTHGDDQSHCNSTEALAKVEF